MGMEPAQKACLLLHSIFQYFIAARRRRLLFALCFAPFFRLAFARLRPKREGDEEAHSQS
jgi:hypothetical protein